MKKTNDPNQMTLFDLSELAKHELGREKVCRWYYLVDPLGRWMITEGEYGKQAVELDLSHKQPWITNSRKEAHRVAKTFSDKYVITIYPYRPS